MGCSFYGLDARPPSMACSGPRASPTASYDHILLPAKEWVHGKSRSPHSSYHRHKHTQQRGPPMTLHNHLLTNTIPLPPHHHIHFLNSKKNVSQNRTHFPQNLSRANPSLPTEHHPNHSPGRKKCVAKSETFCSKSIACCNRFPPLRVKKMYEVWGIGPYSGSSACNEFIHPPASLMKPKGRSMSAAGRCVVN